MATVASIMTADQYAALPDPHGYPTELVKGNLITMAPPRPRHGRICARVAYLLQRFLEDHDSGQVMSNDSGVVTERNPDTVRGADIAYYSYQRVPKGPLPAGLLDVAPELVFEVLSPTERWSDVQIKVAEYLDAGVLAICIVDDDTQSIHVFRPMSPLQIFKAADEFTLSGVLDGFRVATARFFE